MSSVYASSKFAMEGFSDGLRRELNSFGISVSIVEPGYVKSSIFASSAEESSLTPEQEEVGRYYERYYNAEAQAKREKTLSLADEPTVTSSAIFHAISAKYPKTRYPVANADGVPAIAADWIRWMLPARVMDRMMGAG
jgi:short-subunit dehydrogenase